VNTNSRHPLAVRARVFCGNLNTNAVSRDEFEQMFRRFGEVLAVSMHRGYGFIQYAQEYEARNAINFTDGMILGGQRLDVNLASEPKSGREAKAVKRQSESNVSEVTPKRTRLNTTEGKSQSASTTAPKPLFPATKSSVSSSNVEVTTTNTNASGNAVKTTPTKPAASLNKPASANIAVVMKKTEPAKPQNAAPASTAVKTVVPASKPEVNGSDTNAVVAPCVQAPGVNEASTDILICGQCRSLFNDVTAFTAHRKEGAKCIVPPPAPATKETLTKSEGEPETLLCFLCEKSFDHSWRLVEHISKGHGIFVYHTSKGTIEDAEQGKATKEKIAAAAAAAKTGVKDEDKDKDESKKN